MKIIFNSKRLQKVVNKRKKLARKFGHQNARKISEIMKMLSATDNLAEVPSKSPVNCHQLKGDKKGHFAVNVHNPYRIIFKPAEPIPRKEDGGIDLERVIKINIIDIKDYH